MSAPEVDRAPPEADAASIQTYEGYNAGGAAEIPQEDAAAAAAEVAAMEGTRPADRAAEEAVMGAAQAADGVSGFEVTDEAGELVKQRFLEFLST